MPPPETVKELQVRAAALAGRTVGEVARRLGITLPAEPKRAKGFVGQLAERALGADPRAGDKPDFPHLKVELKTIPVRPDGTPAESTFVCSVTMSTTDAERWETSRLRLRLQQVLWLPVESPATAPLAQRRYGHCYLWIPSAEQQALLRADWEDLMGALGSGRTVDAHEGRVLQLRPKAADANARSLAPSEGGAGLMSPMGFYLRPQFTGALLAHGMERASAVT